MNKKIILSILNFGIIILYCVILYLFFHPSVPMGYKLYYIDNVTSEIISEDKLQKYMVIYGEGFYEDEGGWRWAENSAKFSINATQSEQVRLNTTVYSGNNEVAQMRILQNGKEIYVGEINQAGVDILVETELQQGINEFEVITNGMKVEVDGECRNLYWRFSMLKCVDVLY